MKELKIAIPEGYEIDKENSTFEKIVFKKKINELPNTWEEFCEMHEVTKNQHFINFSSAIHQCTNRKRILVVDKNVCPSKKSAEAHLAMIQLEQLRNVYRRGWVPDWNDHDELKYYIYRVKDKIFISKSVISSSFLAFQDSETAYKFLNNFEYLIKQAGDLI